MYNVKLVMTRQWKILIKIIIITVVRLIVITCNADSACIMSSGLTTMTMTMER